MLNTHKLARERTSLTSIRLDVKLQAFHAPLFFIFLPACFRFVQAKDPALAAFDEERPEVDGGAGTDGEDGGGGGDGGDARDIAAVRASAGRGVFYVESKPAQVRESLS